MVKYLTHVKELYIGAASFTLAVILGCIVYSHWLMNRFRKRENNLLSSDILTDSSSAGSTSLSLSASKETFESSKFAATQRSWSWRLYFFYVCLVIPALRVSNFCVLLLARGLLEHCVLCDFFFTLVPNAMAVAIFFSLKLFILLCWAGISQAALASSYGRAVQMSNSGMRTSAPLQMPKFYRISLRGSVKASVIIGMLIFSVISGACLITIYLGGLQYRVIVVNGMVAVLAMSVSVAIVIVAYRTIKLLRGLVRERGIDEEEAQRRVRPLLVVAAISWFVFVLRGLVKLSFMISVMAQNFHINSLSPFVDDIHFAFNSDQLLGYVIFQIMTEFIPLALLCPALLADAKSQARSLAALRGTQLTDKLLSSSSR